MGSNTLYMYLLFDTETTGLPKNWKAPVTDIGNWPRMVQIAWLLYDKNGVLLTGNDYIIKPVGFTISADAAKIHGISTEKALESGSDLNLVLTEFSNIAEQAEFIVAHNLSFDEKIIGAELLRCTMPNILNSKKRICTMEKTTNFVAIPGPYGFKWPKLAELHYKLFNTHFEEQHNAAMDIKATANCFWELKRRGKI
jgi:DNA polymerase III subunit epsilon